MKTTKSQFMLVTAFAVILVCCSKKAPDEGNSKWLNGRYALVDERSMASEFVEFDAHLSTMITYVLGGQDENPEREYVVMDNTIWHCGLYDSIEKKVESYEIKSDQLYINGENAGVMKELGDSLYIGNLLYKKFVSNETSYWSTIHTSVKNDTLVVPYDSTSQSFDVIVDRQLPNTSIEMISSVDWIQSLGIKDGVASFNTGRPHEDRKADITVKCPGAEDYVISVIQECGRYIRPSQTELTLNYKAQEVRLPVNIENPKESGILSVTTEADWISDIIIEGDILVFSVLENAEGVIRLAEMTLSYSEANSVVVKIQQNSSPTISLSTTFLRTDYNEKSLSFSVEITNAVDGEELKITASASWISDISVDDDIVTFNVSENQSGQSRTGKLALEYANARSEFTLTQTYSESSISVSNLSIYTCGEFTGSLTVSISNPKQAYTLSVENDAEWISDIKVDKNKIRYEISENASVKVRETVLVIKYGNDIKECTIRQLPMPISECNVKNPRIDLIAKQSEKIEVEVYPMDAVISWLSYDTSVATVDKDGVVTAVGSGSTRIEGKLENTIGSEVSRYIYVRINVHVPVLGVFLDKTDVEIVEGDTAALTVIFDPINPTNSNVTWTSSDEAIVSVSSDGLVTALKAGTATVTVTTEDGGKTATSKVTVIKRSVSGGIEGTEDEDWEIKN